MTVKELKQYLDKFPDSIEVCTQFTHEIHPANYCTGPDYRLYTGPIHLVIDAVTEDNKIYIFGNDCK